MKIIFHKSLMMVYFIVSALMLECFTFAILNMGLMPEYFFYNFSIILFIAIIIFMIPNYTAQFVVSIIFLLIQAILVYVNYSLYITYGDLFSFDMFRLLGEATAAITSDFVYISVIIKLLAIFSSIVIVGALVLKFSKKDKIKLKQHFSIFCAILMVSVQCFTCAYYFESRKSAKDVSRTSIDYINSDAFLMETSFLKVGSYSKFGTYGYLTNMLINAVSANSLAKDEALINATVGYFQEGDIYEDSDVFGVDNGNNVIMIMMESLEWFAFGDGMYDNEFNNLSYELTPNIYSLIYGDDYLDDTNNSNIDNDALISTNFFSKGKTNYSEAYAILGNHPVGQGLSQFAGKYYKTSTGAFDYSLPNILKREGYKTTYVHSHDLNYYERNITHPNIGFDVAIGKNTLKDSNGNRVYSKNEIDFHIWDAEGDFAKNAIDYIVPKDAIESNTPFFTFYTTVSTHGPYERTNTKGDFDRYYYYVKYGADDCILNSYGNYVLNKPESECTYTEFYQNVLNEYYSSDAALCEEMVYYQCAVMGLDEAVKVIVDELKANGIYDNTDIILYSDHNAYYGSFSNRVKSMDAVNAPVIELNTIPFIIKSSGIKDSDLNLASYVNTRFCSAYDIIPTVLDLLGIDFNENLYLGTSLFAPVDYIYQYGDETKEMILYYSNTGGIFSEHIYTYTLTNLYYDSTMIDEESVEYFYTEATNLLRKLNYLYLLNLTKCYSRI